MFVVIENDVCSIGGFICLPNHNKSIDCIAQLLSTTREVDMR